MFVNHFKLAFFALIFSASFLAVSCNGGESHNDDTEVSEAQFICPMDCENGKTYSSNVGCPVCGMDLVEVTNDK